MSDNDPVTRSRALNSHIVDVAFAGEKNRRSLGRLRLTVVMDIVLSLALGILSWSAVSTAQSVRTAAAHANMATCVAGNVLRTSERHLWSYVITSIEPKTPTVEQARDYQKFEAHLDQVLAPRNCTSKG